MIHNTTWNKLHDTTGEGTIKALNPREERKYKWAGSIENKGWVGYFS